MFDTLPRPPAGGSAGYYTASCVTSAPTASAEMREDLVRGSLPVRGRAAAAELAQVELVLLRSGGLERVHAQQVAKLSGTLPAQPEGLCGQETGPEGVASASRVGGGHVLYRADQHRILAGDVHPGAVGA